MTDDRAGGGSPLDPARILDGLADPVLVISREFRVVYMNAAARTRYGSPDLHDEATYCHRILHDSVRPCHEVGTFCPVCAVFETARS